MGDLVNLMKELFMFKQEDNKVVGLTGFKKTRKPLAKKPIKKEQKEIKLSDLMRRSSTLS